MSTVDESFEKFLDPDSEADDFQNLKICCRPFSYEIVQDIRT